jgi:hypothetical protein
MSRNERIIELLDSIIRDIPDKSISTEEILYRCQEVVVLLKLDGKESKWIKSELSGYESKIPKHRSVSIPATVTKPGFTNPWDAVWAHWQSLLGSWKNITFLIGYPISQLESATSSIQLIRNLQYKVPRRWDDHTSPRIIDAEIPWVAQLTEETMKSIVSKVRSIAHEFALKHRDTAWVDESVHDDTIIDQTVYVGISATGYFDRLVEEVNKCYKCGAYTGSGIVLRKLIENLLYEVLQKAYKGTEKMALIYDSNRRMTQGFSTLIEVFDKNYTDDFRREGGISKKPGIRKIITNLKEIKDILDMAAHNPPVSLDIEELKLLVKKADEISRFLRGVWDALS